MNLASRLEMMGSSQARKLHVEMECKESWENQEIQAVVTSQENRLESSQLHWQQRERIQHHLVSCHCLLQETRH